MKTKISKSSTKKVWHEVLKKLKLECEFIENAVVDNYKVDFYCSRLMIIIVIIEESVVEIERLKFVPFTEAGYEVIVFTHQEVENNIEGIRLLLRHCLEQRIIKENLMIRDVERIGIV